MSPIHVHAEREPRSAYPDCSATVGRWIRAHRHQLEVLRRQVKRPVYRCRDRALLAAASRILPKEHWGAFLVRPETLLGWHRSLVARKWTRPHRRPGRPAIDPKVCKLILVMARENPRWGYLRIKGELGKLGIRASATSIAMLLRRS